MAALARLAAVAKQGALFKPKHFRVTDAEVIRRHVEQNSFATIVTTFSRTPTDSPVGYCAPRVDVSHLPFVGEYDSSSGQLQRLKAHLAVGNPQFRSLEKIAAAQEEAINAARERGAGEEEIVAAMDVAELLVIFNGPHSYVSSGWYSDDEEVRRRSVPTWDYSTVHVRCGRVTIVDDEEQQIDLLKELVDLNEGQLETMRKMTGLPRWSIEEADEEMMQQQTKRIRFFMLDVRSVEAKFKLHQNHGGSTRAAVTAALRMQNGAEDAVAAAIEAHAPQESS